jgi:cell wall-associated NlpC family hydrolase
MGGLRGWVGLGALLLAGGVASAAEPRAAVTPSSRAAAVAARRSPPVARPGAAPARRALLRAQRWVGLSSLRTVSGAVHDDCSGLVLLAFRGQGVRLMPGAAAPGENGVSALWRRARALGALREAPRPGDLVFFRETYDRNRDGRRNDGLTHVGLVERVGADGTVTFVHRAGGGVKRSRLHLHRPAQRDDGRGRVLNDWLRRREGGRPGALAGQLLAGFATVDGSWREPPGGS